MMKLQMLQLRLLRLLPLQRLPSSNFQMHRLTRRRPQPRLQLHYQWDLQPQLLPLLLLPLLQLVMTR